MFKKLSSILLSIILMLSLCSCGASSGSTSDTPSVDTSSAQGKIDNSVLQYPATNNTFRYNVYTHYVTISECLSDAPDISIPDTIDQLPVLGIEANAFKECSTLNTLTIGQNVYSIGNYAFSNCLNLETVVMPSSLEVIGESAFYQCEKLKSIIIPKGVMVIPRSCFYKCTNLKSITIEGSDSADKQTEMLNTQDTGRTISASAFAECSSLSYAWIPDDIITIDQSAFLNSTELLTIYGYATSQAAVFSAGNLIDFVVLDKSQFTSMVNSSFNNYPGLNESIQTNNLKITLNGVKQAASVGNLKAESNKIYVIFDFTVENLSDEPVYFNSLFVTGVANNVVKYPVYFAHTAYNQQILAGTVTKTSPLTGYVAFEVSEDYSYVLVDFNDVANFNTVDSVMAAYRTN